MAPKTSPTSPIKSSGLHLKSMLKKTGHSLKGLQAAEKIDFLQAIADQVKKTIELRQRMSLSLGELKGFLRFEGFAPGDDATTTVKLLLELRQAQMARLAGYVSCRVAAEGRVDEEPAPNVDMDFSRVLVTIPGQVVRDCFALEDSQSAVAASMMPSPQVGNMDTIPSEAEVIAPVQKNSNDPNAGTSVRLHGLPSACLNDLPGTCQEFDDAKQRWMVKLSSGEVKALKPLNLMGPGRQVRLHSLATADFNNLQGTCEDFDDSKQRWMVRLQSGEVKAFKAENLDIQATGEKRPGEESAGSDQPAKRARGEESAGSDRSAGSDQPPKMTLEKLRDIFDRCDINKDGLVNKRELIKTCRQDSEIAKFFDVPSDIRQEDGSRNKLEEVFQSIDTDGDREIRWAELLAYYRHRVDF